MLACWCGFHLYLFLLITYWIQLVLPIYTLMYSYPMGDEQSVSDHTQKEKWSVSLGIHQLAIHIQLELVLGNLSLICAWLLLDLSPISLVQVTIAAMCNSHIMLGRSFSSLSLIVGSNILSSFMSTVVLSLGGWVKKVDRESSSVADHSEHIF